MKIWVTISILSILEISCYREQAPNPDQFLSKKVSAKTPASADGSAFSTEISMSEPIYSEEFGMEENENIDGKSLFEVLSSQSAGRDDGQLCSACHNEDDDAGDYAVPSGPNAVLINFDPDEEYEGKSWTEEDGWAERFVANETKPDNVRAIVQAWIDSGYQE